MSITELIQAAQFLVDAAGNKKAVVLDYVYLWPGDSRIFGFIH